MTVPQAALQIFQGSLFTVTIPAPTGATSGWGVRMQLRSAPVDESGAISVTLTTGGGGIVWNGSTGWIATITPTQSNAMTLLAGVWDAYGDPDGVPDNATVILEFGTWSMRPFVTSEAVVPQPPTLTASLGNALVYNGSQWAPGVTGSIVFQPGGTAGVGVVTAWADVQTFILQSAGRCIVYVDDTFQSPALIPGSSGVTECYGKVEFRDHAVDSAAYTVLQVQDGATLRDVWQLTSVELRCNCQSGTPSLDWSWASLTNGGSIFLTEFAQLSNASTSTHPAILVPSGKSLLIAMQEASIIALNAPSVPIASVPAGASITMQVYGSGYPDGMVSGAGNVFVNYDSTSAGGFAVPGNPPSMPGVTGTYQATIIPVLTSGIGVGPSLGVPNAPAWAGYRLYVDPVDGKLYALSRNGTRTLLASP